MNVEISDLLKWLAPGFDVIGVPPFTINCLERFVLLADKEDLISLDENFRESIICSLAVNDRDVAAKRFFDFAPHSNRSMIAAVKMGGDLECMKKLTDWGMDPSCVDQEGMTALGHAIFRREINLAVSLINLGANTEGSIASHSLFGERLDLRACVGYVYGDVEANVVMSVLNSARLMKVSGADCGQTETRRRM